MEGVLDLYEEPYDPRRPVVCFDETSTQLLVRPVPRGPAAHVLEDLLPANQHPVLGLQVVGVSVAGYRHAGVSEQFSAHLSLAPGSGMAT